MAIDSLNCTIQECFWLICICTRRVHCTIKLTIKLSCFMSVPDPESKSHIFEGWIRIRSKMDSIRQHCCTHFVSKDTAIQIIRLIIFWVPLQRLVFVKIRSDILSAHTFITELSIDSVGKYYLQNSSSNICSPWGVLWFLHRFRNPDASVSAKVDFPLLFLYTNK
jgi:hypothetical protein